MGDQPYNILGQDGEAYYYTSVMSSKDADHYLDMLLHQVDWQYDQAIMFGKEITMGRKFSWYGDEPFLYTYSKKTRKAHSWIPVLLELRSLIEGTSGVSFNSCLLNLYHNGQEGMGWHSDDQKELKPHYAISSLSLGAPRKFVFKHKKTKETAAQVLDHGSLLIMKGPTQVYWQHSLPPTKMVQAPRINLTFRCMDT